MMSNKPVLIAASLFIALGLSACDKTDTAEKAGKKVDQVANDTGKKVGETVDKVEQKMTEQGAKTAQAMDDTEITSRVKAGILAEPGLKSLQISVDTVKGIVTLSGTVDSMATSDKARSLAAAVQGVSGVDNKLVVAAGK